MRGVTGAIHFRSLRQIPRHGAAVSGALIVLGDGLGIYAAMADTGPATSQKLAEKTNLNERQLREWLSAQAASGYVSYDAAREAFFLTAEQVALFADPNRDQVTHITKVCVKAVPTPMPSSLIRDESTKRQKNPTQTPKSRRAGRFTRHRWCRTRRGRWFDRRLARRRWRPLDMSPAARLWALRRLDFHSTN